MAYTAIDDPSAHFTITLYTGTGSSRTVTNSANAGDLAPDLVWIKERSSTSSHVLFDSTRGVEKNLHSDTAAAEDGDDTELTAFGSNGFTYGSDGKGNESSQTYVAWQWKANGGTRTTFAEVGDNPAGGYQANTTAGFSIVDYVGTDVDGATVAHGLGAVPDMVIVKNRGTGNSWVAFHTGLTDATKYISLDGDAAEGTATNIWDSTAPTSTVFTLGTSAASNDNDDNYIAYVFTSIQGYSRFGSYEGNGNANGPFIYTGFKPAFVITKAIDSTSAWEIFDNKREGYNPNNDALVADTSAVEATADQIDLLSNGFKIIIATDPNVNAETYVYMAFAKQPFVTSDDGGSIPCTAR